MHFEYQVESGDFLNAGSTSSAVKKTLKQLNVNPTIIKRTIVALYEAEVNIVAHAYRGTIYVDIDEQSINIRLVDEGPGIPDIDQAMQEGFSTASVSVREMGFGAGMGLPNIKNNSDKLTITSEVGKGTTVEIYNKL
ncbi:MAG: ATP-binding protein [Bacteroidales bacterium]|jgi:anti-sigma regulatory factor (Ser/Thr protein kinase)|nr:ATP-binding protein [Bacteroidales bacterium]MBQ4478796.1 ATP-binding protein [Bacteroidales bacterium]MBR4453493.1 ATP-binding protein [Bacteroidales bacterium]MCR5554070.1 ATP-binding protein [Bacteroidales bacterium]